MAKKSSIHQAKYDSEHIIKITLKLHKENDKDILDQIDMNNKQGSIKKLIRNNIKGD